MTERLPRVGILTSGNGTTAEAFIRATQEGGVSAEVGLVVCSKSEDRAGIYSRVRNLPHTHFLDPKEKRPYSFG